MNLCLPTELQFLLYKDMLMVSLVTRYTAMVCIKKVCEGSQGINDSLLVVNHSQRLMYIVANH